MCWLVVSTSCLLSLQNTLGDSLKTSLVNCQLKHIMVGCQIECSLGQTVSKLAQIRLIWNNKTRVPVHFRSRQKGKQWENERRKGGKYCVILENKTISMMRRNHHLLNICREQSSGTSLFLVSKEQLEREIILLSSK